MLTRRTPMKRGAGFKRRQPAPVADMGNPMAERLAPIASAAFRIGSPVKAAAPVPKDAPVRSEPYRRLVAALPCVMCGIAGFSQAAHGSTGKGMAIKACDLTLFPACCDRPGVRGCHSRLDQGALFTQAVRRELEPAWAADTRRRIMAAGQWPKSLPIPQEIPE